jgi:Spy/CpxP family protein refolding chaperone
MNRITAIIASAMFAVTLFAQAPEGGREGRHGGRNLDALVEFLNLTEDQVAAIHENNKAMRQEARAIMQAARDGRSGVRDELNQENPNPTIVGQAMVDAKETREAIKAKREEYRASALEILDDDQRAKLAALQEAMALAPTARQAVGANLLEGPEGAFGPGGKGRRGGPGGRRGPGGPR